MRPTLSITIGSTAKLTTSIDNTPVTILEYYEGIWMHKRNGIYYASYPTRPSGHEPNVMVYSMAKSPFGPWEYKGPILDNGRGNIHGSITDFKGQWYLFYHVSASPTTRERRVCVELLSYNQDGTIKPMQMIRREDDSKK